MNNIEKMNTDVVFSASADKGGKFDSEIKVKNIYHLEAFDPDGNLKWKATAENIVTAEGINDVLDKYLKGSAYSAAFYVLLTGTAPTPADGDTLASHAGWTEVAAYTGDRKSLVLGTVAAKSVDNSANKAIFAINADSTVIGGAGLATVATGTAGVLYSVAPFVAADKSLDSGDTLNVTVTCTAASA